MRELIVADKQDITHAGILHLVSSMDWISEVMEVGTKKALINSLSANPNAVVILDYTLFDFSDVNEMQIIRSRFVNSDWILFSDDLTDDLLKDTIYNNHTFSIVLKNSSLDEISTALLYSQEGERFICNRIANHMLNLNRMLEKNATSLTATEREILKEIASGKMTKEIAFERNLSIHTIMTHRKNIFRKLNVNNVFEATKYAIKAGIVDITDYYI